MNQIIHVFPDATLKKSAAKILGDNLVNFPDLTHFESTKSQLFKFSSQTDMSDHCRMYWNILALTG